MVCWITTKNGRMIKMQFEYYVLNYNFNRKKVEMFNVFRNIHVQDYSEKEVKKYLKSPKKYTSGNRKTGEILYGFDALCEEIRSIIMWQEWARCEYEIGVGYAFTTELRDIVDKVERGELSENEIYDYIKRDANKNYNLEKWDCYGQCEPNIPMICREIIHQYKEQLKENDNV